MSDPVRKRGYRAFLSYSHEDGELVNGLFRWLTAEAGFQIWFDSSRLDPAAYVAGGLTAAIEQCQSLFVFLSKASVTSRWVREETEFALQHRTENPEFSIVPVLVDECEVPGPLRSRKRIELRTRPPGLEFYKDIMAGLYPNASGPGFDLVRDVYVGAGWRDKDQRMVEAVCCQLIRAGFRLIGDATDQPSFDPQRIRSIMLSCGAAAVILPHRGAGTTSKYILQEVEIARALNLPLMLVADQAIELPASLSPALRCSPEAVPDLSGPVTSLSEDFVKAAKPHAFYATAFDDGSRSTYLAIQALIERVTALPCRMGERIQEEGVQSAILQLIGSARFALADITDDNLNTCIEAGMARGAQTPLHLVKKGPRARPPFLFRNQEVFYYQDDCQLLAIAHRIAAAYRRRTINDELSCPGTSTTAW